MFGPPILRSFSFYVEAMTQFEVIYVSSERSLDAFESYIKDMDWKALPYEEFGGEAAKKALRPAW